VNASVSNKNIDNGKSTHAPKHENMNINSFENWRQNLINSLSLEKNFAPFLVAGSIWQKKTKTTPNRGFVNDGEDVAEADS
jgi:hypothetical protein